ncbi:hypothetical protein ACFYOC_18615 [Nocardiopsis alba]|uniref:hypothetical protein n=1 Tax=Nocardiopsis alba TaxID=53437 RepID=UPI00131CEEA8|nr:hypothetical protein [Nocardiopsis alba]
MLHVGLALLFFVVLLIVVMGGASGWSDVLLISLLSGVLVWLNVKYSFDVFIRLEGGRVEVVNYFKKYSIPVSLIEEIECDNRISVKLKDGTNFDSAAFSESLFSLIAGGATSRSVGEKIGAFLVEGKKRGGGSVGGDFVEIEYRASLILGAASIVFSLVVYSIFFGFLGV